MLDSNTPARRHPVVLGAPTSEHTVRTPEVDGPNDLLMTAVWCYQPAQAGTLPRCGWGTPLKRDGDEPRSGWARAAVCTSDVGADRYLRAECAAAPHTARRFAPASPARRVSPHSLRRGHAWLRCYH